MEYAMESLDLKSMKWTTTNPIPKALAAAINLRYPRGIHPYQGKLLLVSTNIITKLRIYHTRN